MKAVVLLQRLLMAPATASEIAEELGISQQTVSKAVKELVALGHVELTADSHDRRRRRPVRLTQRGSEAVQTARTTRQAIDARIRQAVGEASFVDTMIALRSAMDAFGLSERVDRRAVRPPTGSVD